MKIRRVVAAVLFVALIAVPSSAGDCMAVKSDKQFGEADTWLKLAAWWHEYPHCDDGYFAEGISDRVDRWLSQSQPRYDRLQRAIAAHPEFRYLVLWHIDGLSSREDLKAIAKNAGTKCSEKYSNLCGLIAKTANLALSAPN
jgi:hypothetical protein